MVPRRPCEHCPRMRSVQSTIALLACAALVAARLLGVHVHAEHGAHAQDAPAAAFSGGHHEHGPALVSPHEEHHAAAHLSHGDVDVDAPDMTPGKVSSVLLALAVLGAGLGFLLVLVPHRSGRPPYRIPIGRPRTFFLPPSQAPPLTS
jgi:hypothetical protein